MHGLTRSGCTRRIIRSLCKGRTTASLHSYIHTMLRKYKHSLSVIGRYKSSHLTARSALTETIEIAMIAWAKSHRFKYARGVVITREPTASVQRKLAHDGSNIPCLSRNAASSNVINANPRSTCKYELCINIR